MQGLVFKAGVSVPQVTEHDRLSGERLQSGDLHWAQPDLSPGSWGSPLCLSRWLEPLGKGRAGSGPGTEALVGVQPLNLVGVKKPKLHFMEMGQRVQSNESALFPEKIVWTFGI